MQTFSIKTVLGTAVFAVLAAVFALSFFGAPSAADASGFAKCTLTPSDNTIVKGESVTIDYELTGGGYDLSVDNGVGPLSGTSGEFTVSPEEDTTYVGTFKREVLGKEVSGTCATTVFVQAEEPVAKTCDISANATTIDTGGEVTISWETSGYSDVTLNGEVVDATDQETFTLQESTNFLLQATTQDGTSECTAEVFITCIPPAIDPACTLEPKQKTIEQGQNVLLEWTSENAETVTLEPGFGPVGETGEQTVSPAEDTTYTLTVTDKSGSTVSCPAHITVEETKEPLPQCVDFTVEPATLPVGGGQVTLTWETKNGTAVSIDQGIGDVAAVNTTGLTRTVTDDTTYTLTVTRTGFDPVSCQDTVLVDDPQPTPEVTVVASKIVCTDETQLPNYGAGGPDITANTASDWVAQNDSCDFASGWKFQYGPSDVTDPGDTFVGEAGNGWTTFGPTDGSGQASVTLPVGDFTDRIWFREVLQSDFIPFTFDAAGDQNTDDVSAEFYCHTDVINYDNREFISDVSADETYHCVAWNVAELPDEPAPTCELTASPTALPVGGGDVLLEWSTTNAEVVNINQGIGSVALTGTTSRSVTDTITYTLTAATLDGEEVTCPATITVDTDGGGGGGDPDPFTCASEVDFSASRTNLNEGENTTLSWSTTNVESLSFNQGISASATTSGTAVVSPNSDTTYRMNVTFTDGTTDVCPLAIAVDEGSGGGGGGGGSNSPRCELELSDRSIGSGDEITLTWNTSHASDVVIEDDAGTVISTTEDLLGDAKEERHDGAVDLRPTRDTTYTLVASRGFRDTDCNVSVDVDGVGGGDGVTVLESRDQQPRVAGIALSQVPYTGFEAGPLLTALFYTLLTVWALFVAYVLVIKQDSIAGFSLAGLRRSSYKDMSVEAQNEAQSSVAEGYVQTVTEPTQERATSTTPEPTEAPPTPHNLPTGDIPANIQAAAGRTITPTETVTPSATNAPANAAATPLPSLSEEEETRLTQLEDFAHERRILMSGDALRYFVTNCPHDVERTVFLEEIISAARATYPTEDNWLVLNYERMSHLMDERANPRTPATTNAPGAASTDSTTAAITESPKGVGSLAEAIVTGNVAAAYQLIEHRPMVALADAAADFDALYRAKQSNGGEVSQLLQEKGAQLSTEQISGAIAALTGALDGVYPDEHSAVKIAIMKAIKALS